MGNAFSKSPTRLKADSAHDPVAAQKSEAPPIAGTIASGSDEQWAARARNGDRVAMAELVERHQAAVARLMWRFVRSRADLDDLAQ